jgi:DNA-binding NtrC family response regulator
MNKKNDKQQALIVDDEAVIRKGISRALRNRGIATESAESAKKALELMREHHFDLVLLDIRMPDIDGITLLKQIRSRYPETNVIMITGYPAIDSAVDCIKLGAVDYLVKPFRISDLEKSLENIVPIKSGNPESPVSGDGLKIDSEKDLIVGQSRPMKSIFKKTLRVAPTDSTVLITGESGKGTHRPSHSLPQ